MKEIYIEQDGKGGGKKSAGKRWQGICNGRDKKRWIRIFCRVFFAGCPPKRISCWAERSVRHPTKCCNPLERESERGVEMCFEIMKNLKQKKFKRDGMRLKSKPWFKT